MAFAQGRALVCVQQGDSQEALTTQSDGDLSWETLMDVTSAVSTASTTETNGDGALTAQSSSSGASIVLVTSDSLSSADLVATLSERTGVLFAEEDRQLTRQSFGEGITASSSCLRRSRMISSAR